MPLGTLGPSGLSDSARTGEPPSFLTRNPLLFPTKPVFMLALIRVTYLWIKGIFNRQRGLNDRCTNLLRLNSSPKYRPSFWPTCEGSHDNVPSPGDWNPVPPLPAFSWGAVAGGGAVPGLWVVEGGQETPVFFHLSWGPGR